jgi:hypothetical protein
MVVGTQELRFALRMLGRTPGFTAIAVITLALGIGSATSVFCVADGVLLRPLPYPGADRLVSIYSTDPEEGNREPLSGPDFLDIQTAGVSLEDVAAYRRLDFTIVGGDLPLQVNGASVTPNFFSLLRVDAVRGRVLSLFVDTPESPRAVVLGHGLWQARFGGRADVLGEGLRLNDEVHWIRSTIIEDRPRERVP